MRVYPRVTGDALGLAATVDVKTEATEDRLAALFDVHHQRLYRLARRLTATADDAKDVVQETFLRVAKTAASVPYGASSEEAWLVRILVNVCRDGWRRRATRRHAVPHDLVGGNPAIVPSPEAAVIAHTLIWNALRTLPPRRRAAIVLYELEGAAIPDIARMLGISAVTVRWHLSRGRRDLARAIGRSKEHGHG
jgi:RNA polymerase sigma-70 factor (ECF subfamily)